MKRGNVQLLCDVLSIRTKIQSGTFEYATYITLHCAYVLESPACETRRLELELLLERGWQAPSLEKKHSKPNVYMDNSTSSG